MKEIPIYEILVRNKKNKQLPSLVKINKIIDLEIKRYFIGERVCIRALGSAIHKEKTVDEIIKIIKKTGSDRYDLTIKSDRYDNNEGKRIDFFALDFLVEPELKILDNFTWRRKLKPPLKIDILIVYDMARIKKVLYTRLGHAEVKYDGFAFKNRRKKQEAIKAIFKIIR